jgi:hypothetical protein
MRLVLFLLVGMGSLSPLLGAQEGDAPMRTAEPSSVHLTGHLRVDLFGQRTLWEYPMADGGEESAALPAEKSPWLAAGFSLVIPGSGQFYAKSYWKAALFFAIEVAAVTAAIVYDRKGDEQTANYQAYANQHWSVVQYAQWTEQNFSLQGQFQWDQGNGIVNWDELNRMERTVGGWYSHTLPPYGSQQYYELIGKYPQYNQGWDDAPPNFDYGDPLTPRFTFYSAERGQSNTYYDRASTAVTVAVVNHIVSALDAAWSASMYNSDIRAQASIQRVPAGNTMVEVPVLQLSYRF